MDWGVVWIVGVVMLLAAVMVLATDVHSSEPYPALENSCVDPPIWIPIVLIVFGCAAIGVILSIKEVNDGS